MKGETGLLIIVLGLVILWLGVTGKFDCFAGAFTCMLSKPNDAGSGATQTSAATGGSSLDRVNARLGGSYRFPDLDRVLSGRTPDFNYA